MVAAMRYGMRYTGGDCPAWSAGTVGVGDVLVVQSTGARLRVDEIDRGAQWFVLTVDAGSHLRHVRGMSFGVVETYVRAGVMEVERC